MRTTALFLAAGAVGALAAVAVHAGLEPGETTTEAPSVVTVTRIVDGDTIDVHVDGDQRRVRLLNVDTPESADRNKPVECLGPEATAALAELLPIGTSVTLEYDTERTDRYGRDLAGVFRDGVLVNAELARQGLGVAVLVGENDRFLSQVRAAQREAETDQLGLFAEAIDCTLPAQLAALETAVAEAAAQQPSDASAIGDVDAFDAALAVVAAQQLAVGDLLSGDRAVFPLAAHHDDALSALLLRWTDAGDAVGTAQEDSRSTRAAIETRVAAEEAARVAAEQEAARAAAAAQVEAERAAARATNQSRPAAVTNTPGPGSASTGSPPSPPPASPPPPVSAPPAASPPPGPSDSGPPSTGGSGAAGGPPASSGGDTYTGCRAYGPSGTSLDDKGRPYTKIDCTSRQPIG